MPFVEDESEDDKMTSLAPESGSDVESDSESEGEEDVKLAEPSKTAINNRDGLIAKLQDISWPENVDWIHKLTIDIEQEQEIDVNDDQVREGAFYIQALEGTRKAFEKFEGMGLPYLRPPDYYAEMVKTDAHMVKVKSRVLTEMKQREEAEERKKSREAKKISKEVQAQKQKERTKQKKQDIESVKKWRKQRQQSGFAGGNEEAPPGLGFEKGQGFEKRGNKKRPWVAPGDRSGGKAKPSARGSISRKREAKNSKFGFGGSKSLKKQNTAETTDDFRGFKKAGGKAGDAGGNKRRKK